LFPLALSEFGKTLAATVVFVSNLEFIRLTGYFEGAAELRPLLHTWTLAVEEQFYIFFPLILMVTKRWFGRRYFAVLLACAALSFVLSIWVAIDRPEIAFYSGPTRAFELLMGAILAVNVLPPVRKDALYFDDNRLSVSGAHN